MQSGEQRLQTVRLDERQARPPVQPSVADEPEGPAEARGRRWVRLDALFMAAFIAFGFWLCARYFVNVDERISAGNPDDATLFEWWFAHGARSVYHWENPLVSFQQGFPGGINVAANASLLGLTIPLAPLTMLLGPHLMVILLTATSLGLNACSAYYVLSRYVVRSRSAAAVGGAFFGFAPGIVEHAQGQLHLIANWVLPFIVLYLFKIAERGPYRRNARSGIILGLLVTYQVFVGQALLLITVCGATTAVVLYCLFRWADAKRRARGFLIGAGAALAVSIPLLAYPLWYAMRGPGNVDGIAGPLQLWSENLAAFALTNHNSLAGATELAHKIGRTEMTTWFGWSLCVAIAVAMVVLWRTSLTARIATLTALIFGWLGLGANITIGEYKTGIPSPWILLKELPLFPMLEPARMSYVLIGAVAMLLAMFCERLSTFPTHDARVIAYVLLAAAMLPAVSLPLQARPRVPAPHFFTSGAWQPYVKDGTSLVNLPLPINYRGNGLDELGWQAQMILAYAGPSGYANYPRSDGSTAYNPPPRTFATTAFNTCLTRQAPATLTDADRVDAINDLKYWRASVIVIWVKHQCAEALRSYTETLLRQPPQQMDDVWLWDVRQVTGVG